MFAGIFSTHSFAEQNLLGKSDFQKDLPVKIEALKGIQCDKSQKSCTAFKATATHGSFSLRGEQLKILFDEKEGLQKVFADGDVHLADGKSYQANGTRGTFDMKSGTATLEESAVVKDFIRKRTLKGHKIVLNLARTDKGELDVKKITVYKNVHIQTENGTAVADKGVYVKGQNYVTLVGNVRISNKEGQMRGDRARMNLNTGVSQLTANKAPVKVFLRAKKEKS